MMQDMEQIENDLNSLQDNSDENPFKANGIDICALAESLIKGFSPLETLNKAELASIVAKIEADEVSSQDLKGIRQKKEDFEKIQSCSFGLCAEKLLLYTVCPTKVKNG